MMHVFTLPPDLCFVTTLAEGLWRRVEGDPLRLASMTVYLPTRRACRHLREAFLRVGAARAALLPRMRPLGDIDEDDLDFSGSDALSDIPPAISPLRRQMLLTTLIRRKDAALPLNQVAPLAQALAVLLDQVQTEELAFDDLHRLVPESYAEHWQETLKFLEIVTRQWPAVLAQEGGLDPAARRSLVMEAQIAQWQVQPPDFPVIAAGSTGSIPCVGRLMKAIAALPLGEVILPALDTELDEEAWQAVQETHPQYTMKSWLESSGFKRADVAPWEGYGSRRAPRVSLLREAMRAAEVTDAWRDLTPEKLTIECVAGLERLTLDHAREEADVIALRLRASLENEGTTAALVTPDRILAARVAAALGRWGVAVNDSAGTPLDVWPVGSFLIDVLKAAQEDASPIQILTLLKHPLAAAGLEPAECRNFARRVEIKAWRGVRRVGGLRGAAHAVRKDKPQLAAWLEKLAIAFAPFEEKAEKPVGTWIDLHVALAEFMAATSDTDGGDRLWRGADGQAASLWLDEWRGAAWDFAALTATQYAQLFAALCHNVTVRPVYGNHPRLSILGPLEARLLHHDLIILGGMNEEVWPPHIAADPWLSRPMKKDFGLPQPERRIGLSAHDFAQLAAAEKVLITRARRVGKDLSVPSRFLLQLEAVLQAAGHHDDTHDALAVVAPWREWTQALDAPREVRAMDAPRPVPPVKDRPTKLSVTEISTWLRNPYMIYAKHILKLRKLDEIDAEVSPADFGTIVHEVLEKYLREAIKTPPAAVLETLLAQGRAAFEPYQDRPQVAAFWWPRFMRIAQWFVKEQAARQDAGIEPLTVEASGEMSLNHGAFTLTGRADRIDKDADGGLEIIDYKTGTPPSLTTVFLGYEPQLSLLALMAQGGAFAALPASAQVSRLSYWQLRGTAQEDAKAVTFSKNLDEQIELARAGLEALIAAFADPAMPYEATPKPRYAPKYDDYTHLERLAEWGRVEGGEE